MRLCISNKLPGSACASDYTLRSPARAHLPYHTVVSGSSLCLDACISPAWKDCSLSPSCSPIALVPEWHLPSACTHACMCSCVCVCVLVTQSCPTLCNPMDCSPPGSSVHGISWAQISECVAIPFSRGSSQPRNRT